jgi:hypothetical protein
MGIGKANVRKMFYNGRDPHQTGVRSITIGWVCRVEKAEDERLHAIFGVDRVRMGQLVSIENPKCPGNPVNLPVILYWDPRNTCDAERWPFSQESMRKWGMALNALKKAGVQRWYLEYVGATVQKLQRKALGPVDDKPMCFNPQDLSYTAPINSNAPSRSRYPRFHNPQGCRDRAEEVMAALQTISKRPTPRPQGINQAQSTPRPQPNSHSTPQLPAIPRSQSATPSNGVMGPPTHPRSSTPTSTSLGPNVKNVKKRKPDAGDNGGQPVKKQMLKKLPPSASNLPHGTPKA